MTPMLVLSTRNRHKVAELERILEGVAVEVVSALDLDLPEVEETGSTFAENAMLKARAGFAATGLACIADDSGIVVDALGGEPGVDSALYAGTHGDDEANLALLVERMAGVADRAARFVCAAALAGPGVEHVEHGTLEGALAAEPRGSGGFGYDPILVPHGEQRTCAELAPEEKDAISHRGEAFRALRPWIARFVAR
ncbi:MAG: RdgB/HAM1 family non-canonical purine NTP pyrophosphatase [Actinomycetota bacterium]